MRRDVDALPELQAVERRAVADQPGLHQGRDDAVDEVLLRHVGDGQRVRFPQCREALGPIGQASKRAEDLVEALVLEARQVLAARRRTVERLQRVLEVGRAARGESSVFPADASVPAIATPERGFSRATKLTCAG